MTDPRKSGGALEGRLVVIARDAVGAAAYIDLLVAHGAQARACALTQAVPPRHGGKALSIALDRIATFTWVVFTSSRAVESVFATIEGPSGLDGVKVAVVGPATASAVRRRGVEVDLEAAGGDATSLARALGVANEGARVLFPRSAQGLDTFIVTAEANGWEVVAPVAYETVALVEPEGLDSFEDADAIVVFAPSAIDALLRIGSTRHLQIAPVVAIGETTAAAARARGLAVAGVAASPDPQGVLVALSSFLRPTPPT